MSGLGRVLPVVIVRDFFASATCYAELNGRVRPEAVIQIFRSISSVEPVWTTLLQVNGDPMKLVHGTHVKKVLNSLQPEKIAVAYLGADWESFVDRAVLKEIIVSPTAGSSAEAIGDLVDLLGWSNVHFLDELHAKLYLGRNSAAIGSFNLTSNGLSGHELAEAGYLIDGPAQLKPLRALYAEFKKRAMLQYKTQNSKEQQLSRLKAVNAASNAAGLGPSRPMRLRTLAEYTPLTKTDFYCAYYTDEGLKWNTAALRRHEPEKFISAGTDPDTLIKANLPFLPADKVLSGHWLLMWKAWSDDAVPAKLEAEWLYINDVIPDGAVDPDSGYTKLAVQWKGARGIGSPPFRLGTAEKMALRALLLSGKFPEFFPDQDGTPWSLNRTFSSFKAFISEWKRISGLRDGLKTGSNYDVQTLPPN